jgi:hypothetical protein
MYFGNPTVNTAQIISDASGIRTGENPSYTMADFLSVYSQFASQKVIPISVVQLYIDLADASIKEARWHKSWKSAMSLFVAHWCTLWLRSTADMKDSKDAIVQAGQVQGIITSESVDGVSYSMDVSQVIQDLSGYAAWATTDFGIQLATLAKMYGKGMKLIW